MTGFKFKPEHLPHVIEAIKRAYPALAREDSDFLCQQFVKVFKLKDGEYELTDAGLEKFFVALQDAVLMSMVDKKLLELVWMEEEQEFGFMLTPEGQRQADNLLQGRQGEES